MKLWEKNVSVNDMVESFTVGKDRELDYYLAESDVLGSLAHIAMLNQIKLIADDELPVLQKELRSIYHDIKSGNFAIEDGIEDVHSQVEFLLTNRLGDVGKKIHSGRSRNDQVLVDLKIYARKQIEELAGNVKALFTSLQELSEKYRDVLLPGYTHLQVAMPSSFGLWFGAYAESLADDLQTLLAAWKITNRNPLGSAAGYGSSFPLKRQLTTDLLGFDTMNYNVVYAQMGRGKMEKTVGFALAGIASTLGRLAMDACLYSSQNFGFITLPDAFTTGSSIMPHKKNPDVFELVRARCNVIQSVPVTISSVMTNLPSGYFRDMQIIKEVFIPAFEDLNKCIEISVHTLKEIKINDSILEDDKYAYLFSVEEVNRMVLDGVPFREAYKKIGLDIEAGNYHPQKEVTHTHEGSIGNLCTREIASYFDGIFGQFNFEKVNNALDLLVKEQ
ncbi:argininosuccinate lyase [Saccharicrinis sp. FJH54]|uniref:argininosuccinate lyase n=1 Tax=Saccharicrinis sp. FJH54 TaxID=3344665 RepID=UPI0035D4873C